MKKVVCIVGPTASGKSDISIRLAKLFDFEIISGDSVQVYKGLDIGSAKIDVATTPIKHHLIDIIDVGTKYSTFDFQKDVRNIIDNSDKNFIICGGSGLYIKSVLYNYEFTKYSDDYVKLPSLEIMTKTIKEAYPLLEIDYSNPRRVESAYKLITENVNLAALNNDRPVYNSLIIYLDISREILKNRLIQRLDNMLQLGFIDEAQKYKAFNLNIIGYRELNKYFNSEISIEEAKEQIINASMRFAKRQKTWFLNQMNPDVFNVEDDDLFDKIVMRINEFMNGV